MNDKGIKFLRSRPSIILVPTTLALTIIILELSILWSGTPDYLLPAPSSVFKEFASDLMSGRIPRHALVTLSETLLGFSIAFMVGSSLAVIVNRSKVLGEVIHPYITAFQAMPKIALAPIIILWFGFGMTSKIALVVLIAFFLIFVNTLSGLRSLGAPVLELMRSYGATEWQIFRKARFPNALPFIFAGAEAALLFSLTAAVVGEFLGAKEGLGYLIQLWSMQLKTASSFAAILMLVIVALAMHLTLVYIREKVLFWVAKT